MKPQDLLHARLARGHSQRKLGEVLGVASNTVARWERGERRIPRWAGQLVARWNEVADLRNALTDTTEALEKSRRQCARHHAL